MRLWLLRHAEVAAPPGLCYGASDLPADAAATRAAARALAERLPHGLCLQVSPLQRCELLAQSLHALRPDLTLKLDARLREFDFGTWEGRPWGDIARAEFDAWLVDFALARPGGGECVAELMARVANPAKETVAAPRVHSRALQCSLQPSSQSLFHRQMSSQKMATACLIVGPTRQT